MDTERAANRAAYAAWEYVRRELMAGSGRTPGFYHDHWHSLSASQRAKAAALIERNLPSAKPIEFKIDRVVWREGV